MKQYFVIFILCLQTIAFTQEKDSLLEIYRATTPITNQLIHTKLEVSFDIPNEKLMGKAWITATPHFYPQSTIELDAKAMNIHEVKVNNTKAKFTYANDKLIIPLGKEYKKGEEFTVFVNYTANPNEVKQEGSAAINDAKGLYFIDPRDEDPEKPTQIWTQGETESSSCWFPTIDKPNIKTSQEIYITVPDTFVTLSNGELKSQNKNKDGTRTDYWNFSQKHAPYLFFMGIGEFSIVKDTYKGKAVEYYVEKEYEPYAKEIFGLTPEMIGFYSKLLNYEYPWNKYSQIVCRDYVSGAMENTTAVIHAENANQKTGQLVDENTWEATIAHELFHHWFGDLITTESWSNLTLNESFANYSEYLWFEYKYGRDKAEEHRLQDVNAYKMTPGLFDKDLVRFHYKTREDMFDFVSYNKGGNILHMLRNYLGDDAFFSSLSEFLKRKEYQSAEAHELRIIMEEVSGKDLNWFFNQWYFGNGHPKLSYDYTYTDGTIKLNILQKEDLKFEFPVAIGIYDKNGKMTTQEVWVHKKDINSFTLPFASKPEVVTVNADQVLLCDMEYPLSVEQWYHLMKNSTEFGDKKAAIEVFSSAQSTNPTAVKGLQLGLQDAYPGIQISAMQAIDTQNEKVFKALQKDIEKLAQNTSHTKVQGIALGVLAELKDPSFEGLFKKSIASTSYSVQGNSVLGLMHLNKNEGITYLNQLEEEAYTDDLVFMAADTWIQNKDDSKVKIMTEIAPFYKFVAFQQPEYGETAKRIFKFVSESDNASAFDTIYRNLSSYIGYFSTNNPMVKNLLLDTVKEMIEIKQNLPSNDQLKDQIKRLENLLEKNK